MKKPSPLDGTVLDKNFSFICIIDLSKFKEFVRNFTYHRYNNLIYVKVPRDKMYINTRNMQVIDIRIIKSMTREIKVAHTRNAVFRCQTPAILVSESFFRL